MSSSELQRLMGLQSAWICSVVRSTGSKLPVSVGAPCSSLHPLPLDYFRNAASLGPESRRHMVVIAAIWYVRLSDVLRPGSVAQITARNSAPYYRTPGEHTPLCSWRQVSEVPEDSCSNTRVCGACVHSQPCAREIHLTWSETAS